MSLLPFSSKKPVMGLEVGGNCLKVVLPGRAVAGYSSSADEPPRWEFYRSIALPAGVIENGRIKNPEVFVASLKELLAALKLDRSDRIAIVSVPETLMYLNTLTVPLAVGAKDVPYLIMNNARARLPFEFNEVLDPEYSWQTAYSEGSERQIIACWAKKDVIQEYQQLLDRAGVTAVVLQTPTLALEYACVFPKNAAILYLAEPDFLTTAVYINGKLVFKRTRPFANLFDEKIPMNPENLMQKIQADFKVTQEFAQTEFKQKEPCSLLILSTGPSGGGASFSGNGLEIKEKPALVKTQFPADVKNPDEWAVCLGNALRGKLPRNQDTFATMLPFSPRQYYSRTAISSAISFFQELAVGLFVFYFVTLGVIYGALNVYGKKIDAELSRREPAQKSEEFSAFEDELRSLQGAITRIAGISENLHDVMPAITMVRGLSLQDAPSAEKISLNRIALGTEESGKFKVSLQGIADTRDDLVAFKKRVEDTAGVSGVALPLQNFESAKSLPFTLMFAYAGK